MRISTGALKADGTTLNPGSGDWTASRTAKGTYAITFTVPHPNTPVVLCGANGDAGSASSDNVFSAYDAESTGFNAVSEDVAGNPSPGYAAQDAAFSFIAISA